LGLTPLPVGAAGWPAVPYHSPRSEGFPFLGADPEEKMNPLEMTKALLAGEPLDRLLAMPIFMIYAAQLRGESYADYVQDHRVLVRCQ
jgi:hypothetical protein